MGQKGRVESSLGKLVELRDALKNKPKLEVGVFGDRTHRKSGSMSNADIAAAHEYGVPQNNLPARSFLKVPLAEHAEKIMAPFKKNIKTLVEKEGLVKVMKAIGVACVQVIDGAFDTGGYGKWAPLRRSTLMAKMKGSLYKRRKRSYIAETTGAGAAILIDSRQLQRSIAFRVRMTY